MQIQRYRQFTAMLRAHRQGELRSPDVTIEGTPLGRQTGVAFFGLPLTPSILGSLFPSKLRFLGRQENEGLVKPNLSFCAHKESDYDEAKGNQLPVCHRQTPVGRI